MGGSALNSSSFNGLSGTHRNTAVAVPCFRVPADATCTPFSARVVHGTLATTAAQYGRRPPVRWPSFVRDPACSD
jgi:hypothetical protein